MTPQRVCFRQQGMVEFSRKCHSDLLHDTDGSHIRRYGEGDDLAKPYPFEPILHGRPCGFGRVTVAPELPGESPTDLYTRSKVRLKRYGRQSHAACERRFSGNFDSPFSEACSGKLRLDLVDACVTLR